MSHFLLAVTAALAGSMWLQQAAPKDGSLAHVEIEGIDLLSVQNDQIQFAIIPRISAARSATIRSVVFEDLRLNDMPVYLAPISNKFRVQAGQSEALPAVPLKLYYRDLGSLVPLKNVVEQGDISLTGRVWVDVELGPIESLVLLSRSARASTSISFHSAVKVPGGAFGKTAALVTLDALEKAIEFGQSTLAGLRSDQDKWSTELRRDVVPGVVLVESAYQLQAVSGGEPVTRSQQAAGFRVGSNRILVTAESLVPWEYDPDVAKLLTEKAAHVVPESVELRVWIQGSASALSLRDRQLHLLKSGSEKSKVIVAGKSLAQIEVATRASSSNFGLLEIPSASPELRLSDDGSDKAPWDRVAVFRFAYGARNGMSKPELIFLKAHRQDNRIILDEAVDSTAYGSPIFSPAGVVGMVQDQTSGSTIPGNWILADTLK